MATISFSPTYYEATPLQSGGVRLTNGVTKKPLAEKDAFYQEQQSGGKCSVHSMDAFAGDRIVDLTDLFTLNNKMQQEEFASTGMFGHGKSDVDTLKECGVYLETIKDLDDNGIIPVIMKAYIEAHKPMFNLPKDSSIHIVEGIFSSKELQDEIEKIAKNTHLHRLILGIAGEHYLTLRKEKKGRWRIIDSRKTSHDPSANDKTKKIQPRFKTLKEAIGHVSKSYDSPGCILIAPTKEHTTSWWIYAGATIATIGITILSYSSMRKQQK